MKKTVIILGVLALIAGSCGQATKKQTATTETQLLIADTFPEIKSELPITQRFLSLIRHIDSLGYIFDTLRYMPREDILHKVDNYLLFEIEKESTAPFCAKAISAEPSEFLPDYLEDLDLKPLEKAQKVISYYFRKKQPDVIDGQKWYPDGIIEEWTFANENDAQNATKELMNADLGIIYFNTCAFVCCINKQMYIFHSRASAFMYKPQKSFFKWFLEQNKIELYTLCGY